MLTPTSKFHATQIPGRSLTRQGRECNKLQLSLISVVGTTTNSVNAFDALPECHTFVCCASSAAVLSRVDEHLKITQQLFRARPNAIPINTTPSFYNAATPSSTPGKGRNGSPLKDGGCGIKYNNLLDHPPDSPSQGRANNRSRESSCVSLSRGGNLMAVGEVNWPAPSSLSSINRCRRDIIQECLYSPRRLIVHRMSPCLSLATIASGSLALLSLTTPVGSVPWETPMMVSYLYIQLLPRPGQPRYIRVTNAVMCIVLYGWVTA